MAENVKIIYAPKERRSPSAKREVSRRWQRQRQWASGSGPAAAGQRQRASGSGPCCENLTQGPTTLYMQMMYS